MNLSNKNPKLWIILILIGVFILILFLTKSTDTTPPKIEILSPQTSTYKNSTLKLIWRTNEKVDYCKYLLNGKLQNSVKLNASPGVNKLEVSCVDTSGNENKASVTFTIDPSIKLRFVHIADSHICKGGNSCGGKYHGRLDFYGGFGDEILKETVKHINRRWRPDLAFHGGDISRDHSLSALSLSKNIMDNLSCPYYVIPGNWDVFRDMDKENFKSVFGPRKWKIRKKNNLVIGLDSTRPRTWRGKISLKEMEWLNSTLLSNRNKELNVFIFLHDTIFPTCPVKRCRGNIVNSEEFKTLLEKYNSSYKSLSVLSGHDHLFRYDISNGIHYIVTGSLIAYPLRYRIIDVKENSINIWISSPVNKTLSQKSYNLDPEWSERLFNERRNEKINISLE